ncbi:MAG: hypothetical protein KBS83_07490, partial [Lachnospiraceae bacterium]|nr:hypothetical protein [Candidatus Equihabitans merdae]
TGVSFNHTINYKTIKELLGKMGIRVNCRFLGDATVDEMRHFLRAPLNILADDTPDGRALEKWLENKYGCTFASHSFPVGAKQTAAFLYEIAEFFGCKEMVPGIIKEEEERYRQELRKLRPMLKGKRLVLTTINANIDYLLEALDYIGVEIVKIGVVNYLHQEIQISDTPEKYPIDENFNWTNLYDEINPLDPDIVISNFTPPVTDGDYVKDVMPMTPCAGFNSGLAIVKRWADLLGKRREGGWMNDRKYFEMYQR